MAQSRVGFHFADNDELAENLQNTLTQYLNKNGVEILDTSPALGQPRNTDCQTWIPSDSIPCHAIFLWSVESSKDADLQWASLCLERRQSEQQDVRCIHVKLSEDVRVVHIKQGRILTAPPGTQPQDLANSLLERMGEPSNNQLGNASEGLAWNIFTGYLKPVLSGLTAKIQEYVDEKNSGLQIPLALFIVVPKSGETLSKFSDDVKMQNDCYEEVCNLIIQGNDAGIRGRQYTQNLHRVRKTPGEEWYYFVGTYANNTQTLYDMCHTDKIINEADKLDMVQKFKKRLTYILRHPYHLTNAARHCIIDYDDSTQEGDSFNSVLVDAIRNHNRDT